MSGPSPRHPMNCRPAVVSADGITYTTCAHGQYLSLNYHRGRTRLKHPKSLWDVSRKVECHTFCNAELEGWHDAEGNAWSVTEDENVALGTRGERVAFFDGPTNTTDPWHGYPVGGRRGLPVRRRPPDVLVKRWLDDKWISYILYQRILSDRV